MQESGIDWIFKGPACAVLLINLIFLTSIMWVSSKVIIFNGQNANKPLIHINVKS